MEKSELTEVGKSDSLLHHCNYSKGDGPVSLTLFNLLFTKDFSLTKLYFCFILDPTSAILHISIFVINKKGN